MEKTAQEEMVEILSDFDWSNYGLDEVENVESNEWAEDLAKKLIFELFEK